MGYGIHISKNRDWLEAEVNPITLDELKSLLLSHPELQLSEGGEISCSGEVLFFYDGSKISLKSPREDQVVYTCGLAQELQSFVVGDDQEEYIIVKGLFGLLGPKLKIIPPD